MILRKEQELHVRNSDTMDTQPQNSRYHALDSMRAVMMLLGIYLHVVVGFSGNGHWPYIDPHPTPALDFTLGITHSFRMPAFFVMAGFFGALLWNRRGASSFIRNRTHRVLVPFVLFWTLLFPVIAAIVVSLGQAQANVPPAFSTRVLLSRLHPLHLWFLEYLLILYIIGATIAWLARWLPQALIDSIHRAYRWALNRSYAPMLFSLVSWLPLATMRGNLKDCDGFAPEWLIVAAYAGPFAFGWLLYHSRDLLPRFQRGIWTYVALAVPAFLVYGLVPGSAHPYIKSAGNVLLCWFLIFACTGLFLRYASEASARWRYMSDSSYWLYIMHMPAVIGLQVASKYLPLPTILKVPVVLAAAIFVLVVSYDILVRGTWIGVLLNGRRYPRYRQFTAPFEPFPAPAALASSDSQFELEIRST